MNASMVGELQQIKGHTAVVRNTAKGNVLIVVDGKMLVPAGTARLAAGRDAWLRLVKINCSCCGDAYQLASSDGEEICNDCFEAAGEENERLDNA